MRLGSRSWCCQCAKRPLTFASRINPYRLWHVLSTVCELEGRSPQVLRNIPGSLSPQRSRWASSAPAFSIVKAYKRENAGCDAAAVDRKLASRSRIAATARAQSGCSGSPGASTSARRTASIASEPRKAASITLRPAARRMPSTSRSMLENAARLSNSSPSQHFISASYLSQSPVHHRRDESPSHSRSAAALRAPTRMPSCRH